MIGADLVLALGEVLSAPSPSDGQEHNAVTVSPGLPGFFATFVLAVLVVLLAVDMTRRTRRIQAQEKVRLRAEEQAAQEQAETGEADGADVAEDLAAGTEERADGSGDELSSGEPSSGEEPPASDEPPSGEGPPRPDAGR